MASLFVIREKSTGEFCTGQKFRSFSHDLQIAAFFSSKKNAEKAMRGMFPAGQPDTWTAEGGKVFYHGNLKEYIESLDQHPNGADFINAVRETYTERKCEMEAVEVKLTLS